MRCSSLCSMAAVGCCFFCFFPVVFYFVDLHFSHLWVLLQGPVPPAERPGAPNHILQCRCRCRCRCMCKCSCRCRFMFRCRYYPCGYLHGGRVKESDGECCSQGGEGGAGPPARVRPTSACPVPRRRSSPWAQTHRRRAGPPGSQARRRRSGPPVLGLLWGRGVQFYFFRWGLHFNGP